MAFTLVQLIRCSTQLIHITKNYHNITTCSAQLVRLGKIKRVSSWNWGLGHCRNHQNHSTSEEPGGVSQQRDRRTRRDMYLRLLVLAYSRSLRNEKLEGILQNQQAIFGKVPQSLTSESRWQSSKLHDRHLNNGRSFPRWSKVHNPLAQPPQAFSVLAFQKAAGIS